MNWARSSLVFFLLLSPVSVSKAQESVPQTCTIEGQVVAAATEGPLNKASIMLRKAEGPRQGESTRADASGKFTLKDVQPGRYRLSVMRNGYVSQEYGQRRPDGIGTTLSLAPGQKMSDVVFRLVPAAVIAGRVYDEDGEPLQGVMVQVLRRQYVRGKKQLTTTGGDRTDDLGQYRIYGLAPGQYYVSATVMPGFGAQGARFGMRVGFNRDSGDDDNYPPTYYPGLQDLAYATPLQLRPGEEASATDITLTLSAAVRVRGRVINAVAGQPGRGVMVFLRRRESGVRAFGPGNMTRVDDPQGDFEISGVTPGQYELLAQWSDGEKRYDTRMPVDIGTVDVEGINLVLAPGTQLSGRVHVEGASKSDVQDLRVQLESEEETMGFRRGAGPVKADGSFLLANVSAGEYHLSVSGMPDDSYLKAVRMGGQDVLEEGFKVNPGQGGGTLEIVISPQGGHIEGAVVDENQQPVEASRVVLVPDPPRREQTRLYYSATTDQYGHYSLRGISPGDYRIFSWKEVESGAYQDPEFLKPYEDLGETLRVKEGDQLNQQVRLIPDDTNPL